MSEVLTGAEVKKALKECLTEPCSEHTYIIAVRKALDLINRYEAEIDRLNTELKATSGAALSYKEESERYKGVIKLLEKDVAEAKSEAYKEFAEEVKEYFNPDSSYDFRVWIDNLVKERIGDDNG